MRWWRRWARALAAWWRGRDAPALGAGEVTGLVFVTEADVSELRAMAWVEYLRAELPFPQPAFGNAEAPATPQELRERLVRAEAEVIDAIARATESEPTDDEPDWFVAFADRYLPLACWSVGFGLASTGRVELPDMLRRAEGGLRGLMKRPPFDALGDIVERLREQVERLGRQNADLEAAHMVLWRVHLETLLRPLSPAGAAVVEFDLPVMGARVSELVPPPAPGSSTSGAVGRVLAPSVTVKLATASGDRRYARGALVKAR